MSDFKTKTNKYITHVSVLIQIKGFAVPFVI